MFEKLKLKRQIAKYKKQIEFLEQKRMRSQAALVTAILKHETPDDNDVDFFNRYTAKIDEVRAQMMTLVEKLKALQK